MKIIFMSTPEFGIPSLEALHYNHEIVLVVTGEDKPRGRGKKMLPTPIKAKALELGLDVLESNNVNQREPLNKIRELDPDVIVVVAFGQIIGEQLLHLPKYGCLNIHASLLPKYRGAAPMARALMDGEEQTGISIMKMEKGLDTGPVALMQATETAGKNLGVIHDELAALGGGLILDALELVETGKVIWTKQEDDKATYAQKLAKEDAKIDFNRDGLKVYYHIMAMDPYPGAYTFYHDVMIKFYMPELIKLEHDYVPGTVIRADDQLIIACLNDAVKINEIQRKGKKRMDVKAYLRGNLISEGIVLRG